MKKSKSKPLIIDVRNPAEFAEGHAKGSINIPLGEMEERLEELRKKGIPLITVCGGGTRNKKASDLLSSSGIECTAGGSWKNYAGVKKGKS